jgi:hypothetical protein
MDDVELFYFINFKKKINYHATWQMSIEPRGSIQDDQIWTIEIINFIKNMIYLLFSFRISKCTTCGMWQ